QPLRAALPAPIHRRDGETATAQIGDDLKIFLDELAAPAEEADRSASGTARPVPAREPQLRAVVSREAADGGAARNRVLCQGHQFHEARISLPAFARTIAGAPTSPQ